MLLRVVLAPVLTASPFLVMTLSTHISYDYWLGIEQPVLPSSVDVTMQDYAHGCTLPSLIPKSC